MDYTRISDMSAKSSAVVPADTISDLTKISPAVESSAQGITEFSKEASDAISSMSKASININRYDPDRSSCYVSKSAIDPSFDYIRRRLLDRAGIFEDDKIETLTSMVKSEAPKQSKFLPAKNLNIENFAITTDDSGIRGSSLFSRKGRKVLAKLKDCGVKQVVDLRSDGDPVKYKDICTKSGLDYMKFPIAYDEKWTQEGIDKIPEFVETLKKGDFYIGCATGLHRTDTALALNYFFNPNPPAVPKIEAGVTKNKMIAIQDKIFSTLNDICYTDKTKTTPRLSEDFAKKLGWDNLQQLLDEIPRRKNILRQMNKVL